MPEREKEIITAVWRGITIEITYEADWLGCNAKHGHNASHLEVRALSPEREPLPVSETGYRSHFMIAGAVEAYGGLEEYVTGWLDQEAEKTSWKDQQAATRQLSLF